MIITQPASPTEPTRPTFLPSSSQYVSASRAHATFIGACRSGVLAPRSKATLENYESTFTTLLKLVPIGSMADLNEAALRTFFQLGEQQLKWKCATLASYRKNLNPFLTWCVSTGLLSTNPLNQLPRSAVLRTLPEHYTVSELERLLTVIENTTTTEFERHRDRAIFGVLILAGVRRGELLGLRVADVDFENEVLRVRAETAKNREPRIIKMSGTLRDLLTAYRGARRRRGVQSHHFWVSTTLDRSFTLAGLRHLVNRLSRRLGFRVKIHKMRHTFATRFYQGSTDIVSLQNLLGHRDISTTMIYTHVLPEMTKAALEKNPMNALF